ncbi:hypothetical protein J2X63_002065 [Agromyces sp. 3263]|uniref:hypothetical protein n=1 Tax=Agromyces sp. 3263 TaxID=2817750 RepID=UPI0028655A6A|nr:hypothetical protein [Agromyces sp. 3263]MDR6906379.1 hypothetical protein [Agromyces sp. 3263]
MEATFRLFPWDVEGDPDAAVRLRAEGVARIALAATYHGARTITPRHPLHRIVDLPGSASYLGEPAPLPLGAFSFDGARHELERVGMRVDTWAVIGHVDGAAPGVPRVENAFGDRMPHAPCLSQAPTRAFLRELVGAAARASAGAALHLEAVGWQGLAHGSLHDKLHGADLGEAAAELLAMCVCAACARAVGIDAEVLAESLRAAIDQPAVGRATERRASDGRDPVYRADAASDGPLAALRQYRAEVAAEIATELVALARDSGAGEVSLGAADAVGVRLPIERLVDCWGDVDRGVDALARKAGDTGATAYVDILSGDPDGFAAHWQRLVASGAHRLHVYHAGLASTRRLRAGVAAAGSIR